MIGDYCSDERSGKGCLGCPLNAANVCGYDFLRKAEIERLQTAVNVKNKFIQGRDKAVERAYKKAIKEFAERLISKIVNTPFGVNCTGETDSYKEGCLYGLVAKQNNVIDMVNNLVKEMVGDKE